MAKKEDQKKEESSFKTNWKKFHTRYKNDKQFNAGVRLLAYTIFLVGSFLILSLIAATVPANITNNTSSDLEPTVPLIKDEPVSISYGEMLVSFINKDKSLTIKSTGGNNYIIEELYESKVITGSLENEESITKFVIRDHKIYELKMGEEKENPTLLDAYEIDFIDFTKLITILINSSSTKQENQDITNYIYNNISVGNNTYQTITATVKEDKITTITAINQNKTIEISIK